MRDAFKEVSDSLSIWPGSSTLEEETFTVGGLTWREGRTFCKFRGFRMITSSLHKLECNTKGKISSKLKTQFSCVKYIQIDTLVPIHTHTYIHVEDVYHIWQLKSKWTVAPNAFLLDQWKFRIEDLQLTPGTIYLVPFKVQENPRERKVWATEWPFTIL